MLALSRPGSQLQLKVQVPIKVVEEDDQIIGLLKPPMIMSTFHFRQWNIFLKALLRSHVCGKDALCIRIQDLPGAVQKWESGGYPPRAGSGLLYLMIRENLFR